MELLPVFRSSTLTLGGMARPRLRAVTVIVACFWMAMFWPASIVPATVRLRLVSCWGRKSDFVAVSVYVPGATSKM